MAKKRIVSFALVLLAALGLTAVKVFNDVNTRAWKTVVQNGVKHVGWAMEIYRTENGRYPESMDALAQGMAPGIKKYFSEAQVMNDQFGDKYEIRSLTNGFVVVVTKPKKLLVNEVKYEKFFKQGEAFSGLRMGAKETGGEHQGIPATSK